MKRAEASYSAVDKAPFKGNVFAVHRDHIQGKTLQMLNQTLPLNVNKVPWIEFWPQ
jgi:hypothetical protein